MPNEPIDIDKLIMEARNAAASLIFSRRLKVSAICDALTQLKAERDAAVEREDALRKALESVWHEFDQVYDGPESRIPSGIVEEIVKAHVALATVPTGELTRLREAAVAEQARLDAAEQAWTLVENLRATAENLKASYPETASKGICDYFRRCCDDILAAQPKPQPDAGEARCAMGWCGKPATDGLYCPAHAGPHRKFVLPSERCEHDMPKKICIACGTPTASPDVLRERVDKLRDGLRDVQGYLRHEFRGLHLARIDDILEADDALAAARPGRKES